MAKVNVQAIKDHKDLLIPAGNYEVDIIGAKDGVHDSGSEYIDLTFKIIETIPAGMEIDAANYVDAVKESSVISYRLWFPSDGAERWQLDSFNRTSQGFFNHFDIDPINDDELVAEDFDGKTGGVKVSVERMNKKDPDSKMVNKVKWPVAII